MGYLFELWVDECPLSYDSVNAPNQVNVLGSFFLSILPGYIRYVHITLLMGDSVNAKLLGITTVVSDDSTRRALGKKVSIGCKTKCVIVTIPCSAKDSHA